MAENGMRRVQLGGQLVVGERRPLFQLIDEKLVPLAQRRPGRRYRAVSSPDGQYDVELTDDEEKQRDAEEAAWLADAPKREAERLAQEERAREFRASLKYENRIVAFLDILGWRQAIERSVADADLTQRCGIALNASLSVGQFIERVASSSPNRDWHGDPQITHFSDCVLLSIKEGPHAQSHFSFILRAVVSSVMMLGYLVRGGITFGPLIHRQGIAYGPALNRAYDMENAIAVNPRIILDEPLASTWGPGVLVENQQGETIGQFSEWRRDDDGWYFYDFLQPAPMIVGGYHPDLLKHHLEPVRHMLVERLTQPFNARIRDKYLWAAMYFNRFCTEHAQGALSAIPLNEANS